MSWIGHGESLPRGVPASARQTLYIARVSQNHFVPLLRSWQRGGEIPRGSIGKDVREASPNADLAPHAAAAIEPVAEPLVLAAPACSSTQQDIQGLVLSEDLQQAEEQQRREAHELRLQLVGSYRGERAVC